MSTFPVIDPVSGHEVATLPRTDAGQLDAFVEDARRALAVEREWADPRVRARVLAALARRLEAEAEALAELETRDTGMPPRRAREQVAAAVRLVDGAATAAVSLEGRLLPRPPGELAYTLREPWGVCALILSSRLPLQGAAAHVAPALAAGNAAIVKPSSHASLTPLRLADLALEAGVPRGMLAVATGDGAIGQALAGHAAVDHVTLTGSRATARAVAAACAPRLVPATYELAGLDILVPADADLDRAVADSVAALLAGLVPRVRAEDPQAIAARLTDALAALDLVDDVGPQRSDAHLAAALAALARAGGTSAGGARDRGAHGRDVQDSGVPDGDAHGRDARDGGAHGRDAHDRGAAPVLMSGGERGAGRYLRPAVVLGAGEFSGPVVTVTAIDAAADAAEAHIWSADPARARALAASLHARRVSINGASTTDSHTALLAYTRSKTIAA